MTQSTDTTAGPDAQEQDTWRIRAAESGDAGAVAEAVHRLLVELGGHPDPPAQMQRTVADIVDDRDAGAILLAEAGEAIVGVLAVSWQVAIHARGRYGLLQDLWVDPGWRARSLGSALVEALTELADDRGVNRIEVGLPPASFANLPATEAFYLRNQFEPVGSRMRRLLR
jgi:GNAT superfamily N-acetyltransferase